MVRGHPGLRDHLPASDGLFSSESKAMTVETHTIRLLPHGGYFECAPDQTILDAAVAAGYWLPHSCRSGTCNSCHLTLLDGAVRYESLPATATPLPEGVCRSCQAFPVSDVVLDAPQVPAEPGQRVVTTGARVLTVERPSHDVTIIRLQVPSAAGFTFKAGQYANLLMKDGATRSYSMANAPDDSGVLEWHVRRVEGGRFSTHAYDALKPGALLRIAGPYGTFVLNKGDAPVVLLASGTGYAPIAALLKTHGAELARRQAVVYWGGRTRQDLYAFDHSQAWEQQFPGVRIVPVLSEPDPQWQGRTGFVHQAVLDDLADLSAYEVYACGNPLMIEAARASFTRDAGLNPDRFFADAFIIGHSA